MAFAKPSPLPPFLTKHCISSFRLFFFKFTCRNCSHSLRTNAFYTEGSHALALAPWKEKPESPSDPDDISILNNRIRKELGKRQGLTAGDRILDSAEAEDYIKTVKQQQKMGLQKLKGDAQERGRFGYRADPYTLQPGDYVVHKKVGIGRFVAIKYDMSRNSSEPTEYVFIEYADGMAKLPVKQACRMLYRYNLPNETKKPRTLSKLNDTSAWERRRIKGKVAVQKMVVDLMELYLHRLKQNRASYPKTSAMDEFVAQFPYNPTEDQKQAFIDVEKDLTEIETPMDRLICGDVGFGKTEVALRAIFIVVSAGKQAMVLAPTIVLAKQHFDVISERFSSYRHIHVGLLSRLQRFGVKQKEKIASLKTSVDVLTLSATPIPRTLYLALTGFRDASLISTPPPERVPIKTHLSAYSKERILSAIKFELDRGGQIFYVLPRIKGMEEVKEFLEQSFPDVTIAIAHGKQYSKQLEETMKMFSLGDIEILICTNIVESGLNIQNANTIIIQDVHQFGLAQLYQLRGRVGRADKDAYAYLFYLDKALLSDQALERLAAIEEYQDLGQGFQLAERDMGIRGFGSIFGEQQSGDIGNVGVDLFFEMLFESLSKVDEHRVISVPYKDVQLDVNITPRLPSEYISNIKNPMELINEAESAAENDIWSLMQFTEQLRRQYGKEPRPMEILLKKLYVRRMSADLGIRRIYASGKAVTMTTSMSKKVFKLMSEAMTSDVHRNSLAYTGKEIKAELLLELPKEQLLNWIFQCLAELYASLPALVKY